MLVKVERWAQYSATHQLDVLVLSLSLELLYKRRVQPNYNNN